MSKFRINLSVVVPFFFILVYILPLGMRNLWSPDELRYAEIAREMVDTGNWLVPKFNNLRYFEKPIMGYWLNASAQILLGENNFSARITSALSSAGVAFCLFLLVARFANRKQAWITAGIYLSLFMVIIIGTYNTLDSMLSLWITAVFTVLFFAVNVVSLRDKLIYYGLAGIFCGFAFLTKGFLALALPVIVFVPYMIWQKKIAEMLRWGSWIVVVASFVSLPWALMVNNVEADYWHYFFWIEHIKRFTAANAQHSAPFWFYLPVLMLAALPWLFLIPSAFLTLKSQFERPLIRYSLLWFFIPLLFFSIAKGKLPTYILPCMAPLAILLANGFIQIFDHYKTQLQKATIVNFIAFSLIAIAIVVLYFKGRIPLEANEGYRFWFLLAALINWLFFTVLAYKVTTPSSKVACYMMMPALLFVSISMIIPNKTIDSKMPARFIKQLAPLVQDQTILIADHPSTMSALNWYLKRDDVYLTHGRGELAYGLSYPDAKKRFIAVKNLRQFILNNQQKTSILLLFREMKPLPANLPPVSKKIIKGRFTALYYQQKSKQIFKQKQIPLSHIK